MGGISAVVLVPAGVAAAAVGSRVPDGPRRPRPGSASVERPAARR